MSRRHRLFLILVSTTAAAFAAVKQANKTSRPQIEQVAKLEAGRSDAAKSVHVTNLVVVVVTAAVLLLGPLNQARNKYCSSNYLVCKYSTT